MKQQFIKILNIHDYQFDGKVFFKKSSTGNTTHYVKVYSDEDGTTVQFYGRSTHDSKDFANLYDTLLLSISTELEFITFMDILYKSNCE